MAAGRGLRLAKASAGAACISVVLVLLVLQGSSLYFTMPAGASTVPPLAALPAGCPTPAEVLGLVGAEYPGAVLAAPAYGLGPGTCAAVPTVALHNGTQVGLVVVGGRIASASRMGSGGSSGSVGAGFSRWSGYEAYSTGALSVLGVEVPLGHEQLISASADRVVPSLRAPPSVAGENESARSVCCELSLWVGQTDLPGALGDGRLVQIGVDMAVMALSQSQGLRYAGFFEALPAPPVYFNSTQVPCGMPAVGGGYTSSVVNEGQVNSTTWEYALTFRNDACGPSSYYVAYVDYRMDGQYGEVQSEAPAACIGGVVMRQEQLPQFSGDQTTSTSFSFNDHGSLQRLDLAQAPSNRYVVQLGSHADTANTGPRPSGGGFATDWLASSSSSVVQLC